MNLDTIHKGILKVCPKQASRYAMNHLHLDATRRESGSGEARGTLYATDGRILASVPVTLGDEDVSGFVTVDALAHASKVPVGGRRSLSAHVSANGVLKTVDGRTFPRPTEGEFPRVQAVLDTLPELGGEGTFSVTLDPELLATLAGAVGASKDSRGVTLTFKAAPAKEGAGLAAVGVARVVAGRNEAVGALCLMTSEDNRANGK